MLPLLPRGDDDGALVFGGNGGEYVPGRQRPWDSSKSAVLAMATNMDLHQYQTFVGSLRATGYSGHIILGISPDASSEIIDYLETNKVTIRKYVKADRCTYDGYINNEGKALDMNHPPSHHPWQCPVEYPDYKMTHGRFVLYRDWLIECTECSDGIMLTDARDAYFQAGEIFVSFRLFLARSSLVFHTFGDMTNEAQGRGGGTGWVGRGSGIFVCISS